MTTDKDLLIAQAYETEWVKNWVPPKLWPKPQSTKGEKIRHAQHILYHVQDKKSPYMNEFQGNRILFAWPNLAGQKPFQSPPIEWPSFRKPYLIKITGDHEPRRIEQVLQYWRKYYIRKGFKLITAEEHVANLNLVEPFVPEHVYQE